jgi:hypothetical protein
MLIAWRQKQLDLTARKVLQNALSPIVPLGATSFFVGQER